ncbi:MAG: hypothetical protein KC503_05150 [Myxococcales bacterium]|nr:hypothetical protein [Myxococcales bacterium]
MKRYASMLLCSAVLLVGGCSDDKPATGGDAPRVLDGGADQNVGDVTIDPDAGQTDGTPADAVTDTRPPLPDGPLPTTFGGSRPVTLQVPASYDSKKSYPLVFILHGFLAWGSIQKGLFGHGALVDSREFLLAAPNGTQNAAGIRFWNATDACCGFGATVDDVGYLRGLITEISNVYNVDPKRVYMIGHSNGGFMSYRMACEASDKVAAIVSLAGAMFNDKADCKPSQRVSVLQVHGTLDAVIAYNGGRTNPLDATTAYPSAKTSVDDWRQYNGCTAGLKARSAKYNMDSLIPGDETSSDGYDGCPTGIDVELWTIAAGSHLPSLIGSDFAAKTLDWLFAHPKP